ncbi:zinc finger protein 90-like [Armigeres subalbatus]|uniref:zinc finger protein 90-like n=1 Tax=Armigeres subalbatus TaxID=124917 RepID=UPI002ED4317E
MSLETAGHSSVQRSTKNSEAINYTDLVIIKEEPQIGQSQHDRPLEMFCTLCLRKCASHMLLDFSSYVDQGVIETDVAEQKVQYAIGFAVKLEQRSICITCWKLIELITDFKECCIKATNKLEDIPTGLISYDEWNTDDIQNGIDQYRKIISNHAVIIDMDCEEISYESLESKTICEQMSVFPDVTEYDLQTLKKAKVQKKSTSDGRCIRKSSTQVRASTGVDKISPEVKDDGKVRSNSTLEQEINEMEKDNYQVTIATCEICNRNFDGNRALYLHKKHCTTESPSSRSYTSCPLCTASFMDNYALKFHLNKHKGVRPFKCRKFCDKTYTSNFARIKHERRYCVKEGRICPICGASLKNDSTLNSHMQSLHGEAKYECKICDRKFRSQRAFYDHRRVHSDERKYACTVCDKAFKSPFALTTHKRIHTNENPFACHLCEQAFNYKVLLKTHIERYHGSNSIG